MYVCMYVSLYICSIQFNSMLYLNLLCVRGLYKHSLIRNNFKLSNFTNSLEIGATDVSHFDYLCLRNIYST